MRSPSPGADPPAAEVQTMPYEAPADFTDRQVAEDLSGRLALQLTRPTPHTADRGNDANALQLTFNTPNGVYRVTVLESEKAVRVEHLRASLGDFLNRMHRTTLVYSAPDLRIRLWALYIDFSIFSLIFMAVTGVWLWLVSRPRLWWARVSFAGGTGLFVVLWFVMR